MNEPKNRINEIEYTLNSLEGLSRAEPKPFFATRVLARLEEKQTSQPAWFGQFLYKPAFAAGMLSVFIALNISAITTLINQPKIQPDATALQSFAQEYNLSATSIYESPNTYK